MKLNELYYEASKESLHNGRLWLEEAIHLLYEKGSYGHALSLCLFSIEESVKSWICFTVGIGVQDPNDDLSKQVFQSHPVKMETILSWWIFLNVPIFQQAILTKLDEVGVKHFKEFFIKMAPHYDDEIHRLVNIRMKGMYVDIAEGKIQTPLEITKEDAEGFLLDALGFNIWMARVLTNFEACDEARARASLTHFNYTCLRIFLLNRLVKFSTPIIQLLKN